MAMQLSWVYEAGNKSDWANGNNMSLAYSIAMVGPTIDGSNVDGGVSSYAGKNDWASTPFPNSKLSQFGNQWYLGWGDITFQYNASLSYSPGGVYGSQWDGYSGSVPVALTALGTSDLSPAFSETNVSQGSVAYCRSLGTTSRIGVGTDSNGYSYKVPSSTNTGYKGWLAMWIKPTIPSAARNFLWNDLDTENDFNPYRGIGASMQTTGQIRWNRGDGGGTASSDRYTFGTSATLPTGEWAFVALQWVNSGAYMNSISTDYNYAYCLVYNSRTGTWGWTNGCSYVSGTGTSQAYSNAGYNEFTNNMWFNPSGASSTGLVFELGSVYFGEGIIDTKYGFIMDNTDIYTA